MVVQHSVDEALKNASLAMIYRNYDVASDAGKATTIIKWARGQAEAKKRYNLLGLVCQAVEVNRNALPKADWMASIICLEGKDGDKAAFLCSELVIDAFRRAEIHLLKGEPMSVKGSPAKLAKLGTKLHYVGHLKGLDD